MNSLVDGFVPLREKVVERLTPPQGRFTVPRENDARRFIECSSRNRAISPRGKFTTPNDKVVGKVTVPRKKANKLVFPRKRAEGRFPRDGFGNRVVPLSKIRFFFSEDRITHLKGRFFPPREKIADNFTSPREKAGKGHVLPIKPVFSGGGPSSPRYIMISQRDIFTSPKDMVENKPIFSKEMVVEMERHVRCIIPLRVSLGQRWHVVQHKKFP